MSQRTYKDVHEQSKKHNEHNDCSVRAVALACNVPYSEAHAALHKAGRINRHGARRSQTFAAVRSLGFELVQINYHRQARTMTTAHRACSNGACLVFVRGHVAAMVDGKVLDWTDGRKHRVQEIYKIVDPKNPTPAPKTEDYFPTVRPLIPRPAPTPARPRGLGSDRFGSKIGTQSAMINAAMTLELQTIEQIMAKTGLSRGRVKAHMGWLIERHFVTTIGNEYALIA